VPKAILADRCDSFLGGGFVGALIQAPISSKWGRRVATGTGAALITLSGALQAGSVHIAMFIVARLLCGVGAGIVITNCPVYMSEVSPPHTRGMLTGSHAITIVYAYITSSLLAVAWSYVDTPYQWRLQFVILTAVGLLLLASLPFIPESPRWLSVRCLEEITYIMHLLTIDRKKRDMRKPGRS